MALSRLFAFRGIIISALIDIYLAFGIDFKVLRCFSALDRLLFPRAELKRIIVENNSLPKYFFNFKESFSRLSLFPKNKLVAN